MILLICIIVLLFLIFFVYKITKNKSINKKTIYIMLFIILAIFAIYLIFTTFKLDINEIIPHNEVSSEDRNVLEEYIKSNYNIDIKVIESKVVHRGDIGVNPGVEYIFVLKNDNIKYSLNINSYGDIDLKSILEGNPELELIEVK